jgi:hypothetical protein
MVRRRDDEQGQSFFPRGSDLRSEIWNHVLILDHRGVIMSFLTGIAFARTGCI